jgi:hypothetical protein
MLVRLYIYTDLARKRSGAATGGIYTAPDYGEVVNQNLEVSKMPLLYLNNYVYFLMHS